jgi:rubrerythrin
MTTTKLIKKALIRHEEEGTTGVHVDCDCGHAVIITTSVNLCPICGTVYSDLGYIITPEEN